MAAWSQLQRRLWAIPNRGSSLGGSEGRTLNVRMGFIGISSAGWLFRSNNAPTQPEYRQIPNHICVSVTICASEGTSLVRIGPGIAILLLGMTQGRSLRQTLAARGLRGRSSGGRTRLRNARATLQNARRLADAASAERRSVLHVRGSRYRREVRKPHSIPRPAPD
jgi:hypothetical protein